MKVSLEVAQGAHRGKKIPINRHRFVIGRDPECHLRPASPLISRQHCAVLIREEKVYLQDFGSTNGVQVNGQRVTGEVLLNQGDKVEMDPLYFVVHVEASAPAPKKAPAPQAAHAPADDDSIAALWLDGKDEGGATTGDPVADTGGVPLGNTVMEMPALSDPTKDTTADNKPAAPPKEERKRTGSGDTSNAAKLLLEKYTKRRIV